MNSHPIILFDGVCNYCNSMVNYAIRHDPHAKLRFAPLQSLVGESLRKEYGIPPSIDSVILVDDGRIYAYSDAALRIAKYLNWPAKMLNSLLLVPKFIRQPFYKWVARNRYKWFGKKETCMIPSAEVRSRFIETI
ncbi:MAG: thiol-disulfide oxidoreductase DCC family protein [Chitinophagaceae bacterium]|nr:MAG: thiol-disulfide oxidoreductase DCC family protein [Chitinophagaceae bacterium]